MYDTPHGIQCQYCGWIGRNRDMDNLVTEEAIEAAREAWQDGYDYMEFLAICAPFIGAEALRQATKAPWSNLMETPNDKLLRLAAELVQS